MKGEIVKKKIVSLLSIKLPLSDLTSGRMLHRNVNDEKLITFSRLTTSEKWSL